MRRRGLYEIMLENKQLRARNEILEKKLRELHSINEFYMEEFAMPKYNVDRYFKSYPLKDSSSIDSSSMLPLYKNNPLITLDNEHAKIHGEYLKCKSDSDIIVPVKVNRYKEVYVDRNVQPKWLHKESITMK